MHGKEILDNFLEEHAQLRDRLLTWEIALGQIARGNYEQSRTGVSILFEMCHVLERISAHHLREEETVFYPIIEHKLPRLRGLLSEFQHEHDVFRQTFEEFRHGLSWFNASGELRDLPRLGQELTRTLRQHMEREERELLPLVLKEFEEKDWCELRRLFVESEVA